MGRWPGPAPGGGHSRPTSRRAGPVPRPAGPGAPRAPGGGGPRPGGQAGGMTTTLITGANKSLGFETARRLAEAGHTIYLGSRDEQRGKEAAGRIGARPVQIDVTSDDSVQAAAA